MTETQRIYCISDLHLSPERPDIHRAFSDFLKTCAASAHALYIMGDFFNLWIGDDNPDPFALHVRNELKALADSGTRLYMMHGNRDFLLGHDFCQSCGAELIKEPYVLSCFGNDYLLMHGDSLCTRDIEYMAFRNMVRDPAWQAAFLAKPLAERQVFAQEARSRSKAMSSNKAEDIMDVSPDAVQAVLRETGQSLLVHGHTHRPAIHDLETNGEAGKRIVLGDWDTRGWYLEISPAGYALQDFSL